MATMHKNFYSLLGLCFRAGKLASGEPSCKEAAKNKEAALLIVASDASENTKKKINNTGLYYNVPVYETRTILELGHAIGKEARAVLAVTDRGFGEKIEKMLKQEAGESM